MTLNPPDRFSRYLDEGALDFFQRLRIPRGAHVLDVACGCSPVARVAKRAGAEITAVDCCGIADGRLPFADGAFDAVTSVGGVMFGDGREKAWAELARVCRADGTIALANWTPQGFMGQVLQAVGARAPLVWGEETSAGQLVGRHAARVRMKRRLFPMEYPFPPASVVELFRENYAPVVQAFAAREAGERRALRIALDALWTKHNGCTRGHTRVHAEYLEIVAVRSHGVH